MNEDIKHCIKVYKENNYKVNSEINMDVERRNVHRQVKKGRTLILCDCCNDTKFCNESPMCRHKLFFLLYPLIDTIFRKREFKINEYEAGKSICRTEEGRNVCNQIIEDLKELI